jgi:hypothetical protein
MPNVSLCFTSQVFRPVVRAASELTTDGKGGVPYMTDDPLVRRFRAFCFERDLTVDDVVAAMRAARCALSRTTVAELLSPDSRKARRPRTLYKVERFISKGDPA